MLLLRSLGLTAVSRFVDLSISLYKCDLLRTFNDKARRIDTFLDDCLKCHHPPTRAPASGIKNMAEITENTAAVPFLSINF